MKTMTILGSTGSIGTQALEVAASGVALITLKRGKPKPAPKSHNFLFKYKPVLSVRT